MKLMLYLYLDKQQIKLFYLKKTLLGQFESAFYEKKHQVELVKKGAVANTDLLASAVKEALTVISGAPIKEKEVYLILPPESFHFLRVEVPPDIASTALASFIQDKARAELPVELDNCFADYLVQENENKKMVIFYAIDKDTLRQYYEALNLLNLSIAGLIPVTLAYFKLFEKTLRKDKLEHILYVTYEKNQATGYLYDSFGPLEKESWHKDPVDDTSIQELLKEKGQEYEKAGKKINRLILSGELSEGVRQDTFTKHVGMWTNPLKRIIPHFYQDYVKLLVMPADKTLPVLIYDSCIGGFIFSLENKQFSLLKKKLSSKAVGSKSGGESKMSLPLKEIGLFVGSFICSFLVFMLVSKVNILPISNFNPQKLIGQAPTATPVPTAEPTPTPAAKVDRKTVRVKILNGSGVRGKATEVKDLLTQKGYEDILTGNADNFDFEVTEIQVAKGKDSLAQAMKEDLQDSTSNPKITTLPDSETAADVIVIFGKDFK